MRAYLKYLKDTVENEKFGFEAVARKAECSAQTVKNALWKKRVSRDMLKRIMRAVCDLRGLNQGTYAALCFSTKFSCPQNEIPKRYPRRATLENLSLGDLVERARELLPKVKEFEQVKAKIKQKIDSVPPEFLEVSKEEEQSRC